MDGEDESIAIPGALNIALTIIAAATCCALLWLASHGTLWQIAFAAIAFSYVNNTMFSLLHESVHGIAHRNRAINEWIGRFAAAAFSCAMICPTPSRAALLFYRSYYADTLPISAPRAQLKSLVKNHVRGYREARAVIESLRPQHRSDRVFVFGRETPAFYFRKAKMVSVGDYFGPARYGDLTRQVMEGDCRSYLDRLGISAIIVDPKVTTGFPLPLPGDRPPESAVPVGASYMRFHAQLEQNGFVEYRCHRSDIPVFLKRDISPSSRLSRLIAVPPSF